MRWVYSVILTEGLNLVLEASQLSAFAFAFTAPLPALQPSMPLPASTCAKHASPAQALRTGVYGSELNYAELQAKIRDLNNLGIDENTVGGL